MPFPLIKHRYTCQNTATGKQQCDPRHEIACIAGLGRIVSRFRFDFRRLFLKGGNGILDSLRHCVNLRLLGNVLVTDDGINGSFHIGEVLVVVLVQGVCLGNGCVDLGVVGR